MNIATCRPSELGPGELEAWRNIQAMDASFDNPFLSPEFTLAAGRTRDNVRVAIIEDDNKPVAFLPYEVRPFGIGRAVGFGVSDLQGIVHHPEYTWSARDLLAKTHVNVFEFDHWLPSQTQSHDVKAFVSPSAVMDLSNGYDAYMKQDGRSSRRLVKSIMQKRRKLEREHGEITFSFDTPCEATLDLLMRFKSDQYRRSGRSDRFAKKWIRDLVKNLYETKNDDFSGVLSVLYVRGEPISFHFGIRTADTLALWFPSYDPDFHKYSPGLQMFLEIAQAAPEHGLKTLDLGKGEEEFKQSLKSYDRMVATGRIEFPSATAYLHRLHRVPVQGVEHFVLSHPRARVAARKTLKHIGTIRSAVSSPRR
jgi:CelD/BcsL family acetyltransferase involved in cellulose biosynthesis